MCRCFRKLLCWFNCSLLTVACLCEEAWGGGGQSKPVASEGESSGGVEPARTFTMSQKKQVYQMALTDVEAYDEALIAKGFSLFFGEKSLGCSLVQSLLDFSEVLRKVLGNREKESWLSEKVSENSSETYLNCVRQILVNVVKRFLQIGRQEMSVGEILMIYEGFVTRGLQEALLDDDGSEGAYLRDVVWEYKSTLWDEAVLDRSKLADCQKVRDELNKLPNFSDVLKKLNRSIEEKEKIFNALTEKKFLEWYNPRVMAEARPQIDSVVDRICFFNGFGIKLFQFVNIEANFKTPNGIENTESVVMDCFLSLESDSTLDLSQFRIFKVRSGHNYFFDGNCYKKIPLLSGDDSSFEKLSSQRQEILDTLAFRRGEFARAVCTIAKDQEAVEEISGVVAHDLRKEEEKNNGDRLPALQQALIPVKIGGALISTNLFQYRPMLFPGCFEVGTSFVHSTLANTVLGESGIGDKYLLLEENTYSSDTAQKLFIRWHVYTSDTLLKKAMDKFIKDSLPADGEFSYLSFKSGHFVRISGEQYKAEKIRKKKPIITRLGERILLLKDFLPEAYKDIFGILMQQRDDPDVDLDPNLIGQLEAMLSEVEAKKAWEEARQERESVWLAFKKENDASLEALGKAEDEREKKLRELAKATEQRKDALAKLAREDKLQGLSDAVASRKEALSKLGEDVERRAKDLAELKSPANLDDLAKKAEVRRNKLGALKDSKATLEEAELDKKAKAIADGLKQLKERSEKRKALTEIPVPGAFKPYDESIAQTIADAKVKCEALALESGKVATTLEKAQAEEKRAQAVAETNAQQRAQLKGEIEVFERQIAEEAKAEAERLEKERLVEEQARKAEEAKQKMEAAQSQVPQQKQKPVPAPIPEGVLGKDIIDWVNKVHANTPAKKIRGKRGIVASKIYTTSTGMTDIAQDAFRALKRNLGDEFKDL